MRDSPPRRAQAAGKAFGRKQRDVNVEMKGKELTDSDRKVQESLDNFIRQAIVREPFLPFPRTSDSPMPWIRWLDTLDQQSNKVSKGLNADVISDIKGNHKEEGPGIGSPSEILYHKDSGPNGMKNGGVFGRGFQNSSERTQALKIPEAMVALAQAAAKDLPGWHLTPPVKAPCQKCVKCSTEFYSPLNYRRHMRMHRKPLIVDKGDLRKERHHLAEFWDKLTVEKAYDIVNCENITLEGLLGASVVQAMPNFIQQAGLMSPPQSHLKAGITLLEIVQHKLARFPLSSEELFGIIDDASEKTFLFGSSSAIMHRFLFEGDGEKVGLEPKNLIASLGLLIEHKLGDGEKVGLELKNLIALLGLLIEHKLVSSWIADKDAEALRCLEALVEEEEAAQKKRMRDQEKKRLKKVRQKDRKALNNSLPGLQVMDRADDEKSTVEGSESSAAMQSSPSSIASSMMHELANSDHPSNTSDEKPDGFANGDQMAEDGSLCMADDNEQEDNDNPGGQLPDVMEIPDIHENIAEVEDTKSRPNRRSYTGWRERKQFDWIEGPGSRRPFVGSNGRRLNGTNFHVSAGRNLRMNGKHLNEFSGLARMKPTSAPRHLQYREKSSATAIWTRKVHKEEQFSVARRVEEESLCSGRTLGLANPDQDVEGAALDATSAATVSASLGTDKCSRQDSEMIASPDAPLSGVLRCNNNSTMEPGLERRMEISTVYVGSVNVPLGGDCFYTLKSSAGLQVGSGTVAKVWRPVSTVGEHHHPSFPVMPSSSHSDGNGDDIVESGHTAESQEEPSPDYGPKCNSGNREDAIVVDRSVNSDDGHNVHKTVALDDSELLGGSFRFGARSFSEFAARFLSQRWVDAMKGISDE